MTDLALAAEFPAATDTQWREAVARALKGADFDRKLTSRTADGIVIQPLYPKADGDVVAKAAAGPWRIVQRVDLPTPAMAQEQAAADLAGGADALSLCFSGSRAARGAGLHVENLAELDHALDGVMLDLIHLRIEPTPAARVHAALVAALAEKRGHAPDALDISFGLDPIGLFAGTGRLSAPFDLIAKRTTEAIGDLAARGFRGPFLTCDGRIPHEAGSSEAQELAYVLACGVAWLRGLEANGLALDAARRALSFTLVADADEFLTIAKMRALRKLWARIEEACGLAPEPIRLHAETAWRSLTQRDPHVNLLRGTIAVFAAGIGGADSVTALPFTSALGLPDAFARRLARNTQLILIEESNLAKVADPAAGAGGFEALTDAFCEKAWALFQEIEREGGIVASLGEGKLQARIATTRAALEKAIATRKAPITGASEFPNIHEAPVAVLDAGAATPSMGAMRREGPRLDFSGMIDAMKSGAMRGGFAPHPHPHLDCAPLTSHRLAEPFEALRDHSDHLLQVNGARPKIFLANLGPIAAFTARAMFAKNFFEAGGIEAEANDGFAYNGDTDLVAMTDAFKRSGAKLACLCGSDDFYHREAIDAAMALKASGADAVWLAGHPTDMEAQLRAAGVEGFIYMGCDAVAALAEAQAHAE